VTDIEVLATLKRNIVGLRMSLIDAPYQGVNSDEIKAIEFSINKIIEGTGVDSYDIDVFKEDYLSE